jgi:hypothetical protein
MLLEESKAFRLTQLFALQLPIIATFTAKQSPFVPRLNGDYKKQIDIASVSCYLTLRTQSTLASLRTSFSHFRNRN